MTAGAGVPGGRRRGRFWWLAGLVLCLGLPPFFSWPALRPLPAEAQRAWQDYWDATVKLKVDHPLFDYTAAFPADSNQAKRNFRLTVPVLAHASGAGMAALPWLRGAALGVLLLGLLAAARCAAGPGPAAVATALAVAGTYVGTSLWMDQWGWFDVVAHAGLALALAARAPWLVGTALFAAAFTDERALLAAPLVALFHRWTGNPRAVDRAVALGVLAYLAGRAALAFGVGLRSPYSGIGSADVVLHNLSVLPAGVWSALEGGWILVGAAGFRAAAAGRRADAALLAAAALGPALLAALVVDFTRSASYAFPATLAAAALLARTGPPGRSRRWLLAAAAVSLLAPNLFVMGQVFVQRPYPLRERPAAGIPVR